MLVVLLLVFGAIARAQPGIPASNVFAITTPVCTGGLCAGTCGAPCGGGGGCVPATATVACAQALAGGGGVGITVTAPTNYDVVGFCISVPTSATVTVVGGAILSPFTGTEGVCNPGSTPCDNVQECHGIPVDMGTGPAATICFAPTGSQTVQVEVLGTLTPADIFSAGATLSYTGSTPACVGCLYSGSNIHCTVSCPACPIGPFPVLTPATQACCVPFAVDGFSAGCHTVDSIFCTNILGGTPQGSGTSCEAGALLFGSQANVCKSLGCCLGGVCSPSTPFLCLASGTTANPAFPLSAACDPGSATQCTALGCCARSGNGLCQNVPSGTCTLTGGTATTFSGLNCPAPGTTGATNPCACCVTVSKFCVKSNDQNKDEHQWGDDSNFWGHSSSSNGAGSLTGCTTRTNSEGVQLLTGCDQGDFIKRNNKLFAVDNKCDVQWSPGNLNATFIILVESHCNIAATFTLDDPGVFAEEDDFHTSGTISPGQFLTFFVTECIACDDVVDTVTLTASTNAGVSGSECVSKASATVLSSAKNSNNAWQPIGGPSWGGGSWSPPSPPWQHSQGLFAPFPNRR